MTTARYSVGLLAILVIGLAGCKTKSDSTAPTAASDGAGTTDGEGATGPGTADGEGTGGSGGTAGEEAPDVEQTPDVPEDPEDVPEPPKDVAEEPADVEAAPKDVAEEPKDAAEEPAEIAEPPVDAGPVGETPLPQLLCEKVAVKVAQCVADDQFLEVYVGRLLTVMPKLTEEQETNLKVGAKTQLGTAVSPMVIADRCQKQIAGGRWIRSVDAKAVYAALSGTCVQLGEALGEAQATIIRRVVPRATDPRPRRK